MVFVTLYVTASFTICFVFCKQPGVLLFRYVLLFPRTFLEESGVGWCGFLPPGITNIHKGLHIHLGVLDKHAFEPSIAEISPTLQSTLLHLQYTLSSKFKSIKYMFKAFDLFTAHAMKPHVHSVHDTLTGQLSVLFHPSSCRIFFLTLSSSSFSLSGVYPKGITIPWMNCFKFKLLNSPLLLQNDIIVFFDCCCTLVNPLI